MSRARLCLSAAFASTVLVAAGPACASVPYISGGPGNAEVQALKREGRSFPLNLVFTEGRRSTYVKRVRVTIEGANGTVLLHGVSSGPVMLLELPTGTYRISAESRGRTMERTVHVKAKGFRRVDLHWWNS